MTRRNLRESIFRIVFKTEFFPSEEMEEQTELTIDNLPAATDEDKEYIRKKAQEVLEKISIIDIILSEASEGWNIRRIGKPELAILRLAVYEIRYDDDVPYKVAINEAIELSKKYCNPEAAAFVNGVLARVKE